MGIGGFFLLLLALIVVALLGAGFYLVSMWLRGRRLAPERDQTRPNPEDHPEDGQENGQRPEHVEVESEQRARFIGSR